MLRFLSRNRRSRAAPPRGEVPYQFPCRRHRSSGRFALKPSCRRLIVHRLVLVPAVRPEVHVGLILLLCGVHEQDALTRLHLEFPSRCFIEELTHPYRANKKTSRPTIAGVGRPHLVRRLPGFRTEDEELWAPSAWPWRTSRTA